MFKSKIGSFERVAKNVNFVALDVGARGGFNDDLLPISGAVDYFGFEPDPEECDKLNKVKTTFPWKSVTYLPTALADKQSKLMLNLYRQRGCSSVLPANKELGERFSRGDYYIHDGQHAIDAQSLDDIVETGQIQSPAYMKIDVQGMEVDVFKGAQTTLSESLVGIRTEVSFFALYDNQPLFAEVDQLLRPYGFVPMQWVEFHEWRRSTREKYPKCTHDEFPCSRGQMIHGDVLYLMQPEVISEKSEDSARRLVRLGMISACYGHIDHAYASFSHPAVLEYLGNSVCKQLLDDLQKLSHRMAKRAWFISMGTKLLNLLDSLTG